jgi:HD-like signal output (HDOD) protein
MGERAVVAAALEIGAEWIHASLAGYGVEARLFDDGIRTATLASRIAKRTRLVDLASTAYTAGLLRDLGKIVSSSFLAARRAPALEALASGKADDWLAVEQGVLGIDHCALGARIAARFKLPDSLRSVIEFHHAPSRAEPAHRPLVAIVHLADAALAMLGGTESIDALAYRFDPSVIGLLGLDDEAFEAILVEGHAEASKLLESVGRGRAAATEAA